MRLVSSLASNSSDALAARDEAARQEFENDRARLFGRALIDLDNL